MARRKAASKAVKSVDPMAVYLVAKMAVQKVG